MANYGIFYCQQIKHFHRWKIDATTCPPPMYLKGKNEQVPVGKKNKKASPLNDWLAPGHLRKHFRIGLNINCKNINAKEPLL